MTENLITISNQEARIVKRLAVVLLFACFPATVQAQAERYELGRRLRRFEDRWEHRADPEGRKRALPHLQTSVRAFFSLRLGEAARSLDLATWHYWKTGSPSDSELWAMSLNARPTSPVIDQAQEGVAVRVQQFYAVASAVPEDSTVEFHVHDRKRALLWSEKYPITALPLEINVPLKGLVEGDYRINAGIETKGGAVVLHSYGLSVVDRLEPRLRAIKSAVEKLPSAVPSTDLATLKHLVKLLSDLAEKKTQETDYPAVRLLREAEERAKALGEGKGDFNKNRPGEFWLSLATAKGQTAVVRLKAPQIVKDGKPLPIVFALHGAGGSENMFFDGYGMGKVVKLCEEREWLVVAPRSGLLSGSSLVEILDALRGIYPVNEKRVFIVGHSMGASQAISAACDHPTRFAAVAALGGGGRVRASEDLKRLPFYVAVGSQDFALRGAKLLKEGLDKAGCDRVVWKEHANIEHLVIVQAALPDVFAFFDDRAGE
jgi:pimeloyl-ACP methyl ester carboxylesterase